jgi:hypothetical protein
MDWVYYYKKMYSNKLYGKTPERRLLSPHCPGAKISGKDPVAIICPGARLRDVAPDPSRYERILAINLAASADVGVTDVLFERITNDSFGDAQFKLLINHLTKTGTIRIYAKNTWNKNFYPDERMDILSEKVEFLKDIPLRGGSLLTKRMIVNYLMDDNVGFSNWKSSLFAAISLLKSQGARSINVYGIGGDGYFWEKSPLFPVRELDNLQKVKAPKTHGTQTGRHKVPRILSDYCSRNSHLNKISIEIV